MNLISPTKSKEYSGYQPGRIAWYRNGANRARSNQDQEVSNFLPKQSLHGHYPGSCLTIRSIVYREVTNLLQDALTETLTQDYKNENAQFKHNIHVLDLNNDLALGYVRIHRVGGSRSQTLVYNLAHAPLYNSEPGC